MERKTFTILIGRFLTIILLLISFDSHTQNPCIKRIIEEASRIDTLQASTGTGFIINSEGFVITNRHVIERSEKLDIVFEIASKKIKKEAKVLFVDGETDLAILQIDTKDIKVLLNNFNIGFSDKEMKLGESIYVLGYPSPVLLGSNIKLTEGLISGTSGFLGDKDLYQISASIQPGNSGSPLIDKFGNIRGVVVSSYIKGQLVNYAIKGNKLKELVKSYNNTKNQSEPFIKLPLEISQNFQQSVQNFSERIGLINNISKKVYFQEFDIYSSKKPMNWTFTNCNDKLLSEFVEGTIDSDNVETLFNEPIQKALLYSYYFRNHINSTDRTVGFIFYGLLFEAKAYENILEIANSEFPINKILSNTIDMLALEMYMRTVFPHLWISYFELYFGIDSNQMNFIDTYITALHNYLKNDKETNYLLDETYIAKANMILSMKGHDYKLNLCQLIKEFDADIAYGHIDISMKGALDDFRSFCE